MKNIERDSHLKTLLRIEKHSLISKWIFYCISLYARKEKTEFPYVTNKEHFY